MNNKDITKVIMQGRAFKSSSFLLKIYSGNSPVSRNVAIVASKKVFKTAVLRNKVKRKIRSALVTIKRIYPDLVFNKTDLFVYTAFDSLLSLNHQEVVGELRNVFLKSGMLKL